MTYKILTFVPGAEESREKFGYVGQAGQLLTSYFAQLWPEDLPPVMLGNAVLCRPKDNATPTISQYKKCGKNFWPYLLTDHNLIADNCLILATGSIAYKMLYAIADGTPSASAIMSAHGKPVQLSFRNPDNPDDLRTFWIVPMIHPAYVLRGQTPERYTLLKEDFIVAYNAYYDIQETGTVNMAALLNQSSDNAIDLDKDLQGDVYDHLLTDKEADLIMEMIESDYKNMTGEDDKKIVSYDVETTALETQYESTVITLAGIGTLNKSTFQFEGEAIPSIGKIFKRLKEKGYYLVGHNIWYDLIMSWKTGIFSCVDDLPEIRDTRVMHKLLDENSADNKLKWLCQKYFGIADWSQELNSMMDSEGKVQWSKLDDEKRQSLRKYHKGDLYWTTKLCYLLMDKLKESGASDYWKIDYVDFKCRLHKELIQTSINGFMIDPKALEAQRTEYQTKQDAVVEWFHQPLYYRVVASLKVLDKPLKEAVQSTLCNFALGDIYNPEKDAFNPNSTQHVAALLATVLSSDDSFRQQVIRSLGRKGKTPKGRLSLNEDSIEKICETLVSAKTLTGHSMAHKYDHLVEGLKKVLEFRGLKKILSTYLEGMAKFIWPDGSVRAQWNVDGAATGRLSCVAEGSLVACVDGNKPIESVKVGDMVYCYDEDDNLVTRPVLAVLDQGYKECMEFFWRKKQSNDSDFEQGSLICTPDHLLKQCVPQLNNRTGWLQAKDCMEPLFGINLGRKGYWYQIVSRWHVGIKHVYDLTVDECHNFIANELVSHNCSRPNLYS